MSIFNRLGRNQPPSPKAVKKDTQKVIADLAAKVEKPKAAADDGIVRVRGRPASGKQVVSIRLDRDVVEKFKATGDGWQARINDVLKAAKL